MVSLQDMIAMEEYIEKNDIIYFHEFSKEIRRTNSVWYRILTTERPEYFQAFIESRRRIVQGENNK